MQRPLSVVFVVLFVFPVTQRSHARAADVLARDGRAVERIEPVEAEVVARFFDESGYLSADQVQSAIREAVERGEINDPALRPLPSVSPRFASGGSPACVPTTTTADVFPFEDTDGLLLTNFSTGQALALFTEAANAVMIEHGDHFDFVAFWVNFNPHHTIGTAVYFSIENDVSGIGLGPFNGRPSIGLAGDNVEGYVSMWNINSGNWAAGAGGGAAFTRLVLGQEFEHRFGMFLPNLLSGEQLQGDNASCGRGGHWHFSVDGQGSGMEIREWVGTSPASRIGGTLTFNTDIAGSVFSYSDLYLMGYVSPAEMDAGNSELRYMQNNCNTPYNGPIKHFTSADIIAAAGARSPDSTTAQQHFRTAWIMIHQPGDPPSAGELDKAVGILTQHTADWNTSTLGRGTMTNSLRGANPEVVLQPVSADVDHKLLGSEILVPAGGAQITVEVRVANWDPCGSGALLADLDVQLDSSGYTSGTTGSLSPLTSPDATAGAFIDNSRSDYAFTGVGGLTETVDTSTLDYAWSIEASSGGAIDPIGRRYAGTLILDVSADATGTFTVDLMPDPDTQLADDGAALLTPVTLSPLKVTIVEPTQACMDAGAVSCNSIVPINNASISLAPNPGYSCGAGSNHNGTLWFRFTASSTSARVHSCNSTFQDSTLAVYDGNCDLVQFRELGCSEDVCGPSTWLSDTCVSGLIPGNEYLIQFSAWSSPDRGPYSMEIICPCDGPAPGACCYADGSCDDGIFGTDCATGGGAFLGEGVTCPNCDDGNACTADGCTVFGTCDHDGTGITDPCDDLNDCTFDDACSGDAAGECIGQQHCQLFADLAPFDGDAPNENPIGNCVVDLDDILVELAAFSAVDPCDPSFPDIVNLIPCGQDCNSGVVDLDDILAALAAFSGNAACPHPCAAGACCFGDSSCQDWDGVPPGTTPQTGMDESLCVGAGGTYQNDGSTCATVSCP